jgi:hypothetical protein
MRTRSLVAPLSTVLLAGCSLFGIRSGYEQPPYEIVERLGADVEIRRYGPRLAAETTADGEDAGAARDAAFGVLASYIFGANAGGDAIAMTAPVQVGAGGEEIAMTVPVQVASAGAERSTMRFFLPTRYELGTAPTPTDARVRLLVVPPETVAVLRFSGSASPVRTAAQQTRLLHALQDSRWTPTGAPAALYYDPPWTIPWLRRNEAVIAVTADG